MVPVIYQLAGDEIRVVAIASSAVVLLIVIAHFKLLTLIA